MFKKKFREVRLNALAHLCDRLSNNYNFKEEFTGDEIYDIIADVAPTLNETFNDCRWQDENWSCTKFFVPVLTEHGLCFTLNFINSREIYTEE